MREFQCFECRQFFDSMWGNICNQCRAAERRHQEILKSQKSDCPKCKAFDSLLKDAHGLVEALKELPRQNQRRGYPTGPEWQFLLDTSEEALQSFNEKWPSKVEKVHEALKDMDGTPGKFRGGK